MQTTFHSGQTLRMENQKFDVMQLEVLAQVEAILAQVAEEITVESRIEKLLEVTQLVRQQHESINLIDRIRNTDGEVTVQLNCQNFSTITGSIKFTSDNYLVISNANCDYFLNCSFIELVLGVDSRAVFRTTNLAVDTTLLWLKNLIEVNKQVSIQLASGKYLSGQIIRSNYDHLDLLVNGQTLLIPLHSIVLLRSIYGAN